MKRSRIFVILLFWLSTVVIWFATDRIHQYDRESEPKEQGDRTDWRIKSSYENAWIISWKQGKLLFYAEGEVRELPAETSTVYENVLADLQIEKGSLSYAGIKAEQIQGKVLSIGTNTIEIEGYGKVPLSEHFHVYCNYGTIREAEKNEIIVGYDSQSFFVGNGKLCGALLQEELQVSDIRVLLLNQEKGTYHSQVILKSDGGLMIENRESNTVYEAMPNTEVWFYEDGGQQMLWLEQQSGVTEVPMAREQTYHIVTGEDSRIMLCSVEKWGGNPAYRGKLEVVLEEEGYLVRNELSLEEYLYAVVPSEMPASYGLEALKAQAVCARSYAYRNILDNSLSIYGAHVDDSTAYQVYHNIEEQESTSQAVRETRGQVMRSGAEIINAFYFSTSCGSTTDATIWGGGDVDYVQGRLISSKYTEPETALEQAEALRQEENFRSFITERRETDYDFPYPWYRWSITFSQDEIEELLQAKGLDRAVGRVQSLEAVRRGSGGVVEELRIAGEEGTAVMEKEYAIRCFLSPLGRNLYDGRGSVVTTFSALPSAYFIIDQRQDEENLWFTLTGGGFGHGAGMSQNAANQMAAEGMGYEEILKSFYYGMELQTIVE